MSRKKKRKPKPKREQRNARPASNEIVVYTPEEAEHLPITQAFAADGSLPPINEENLLECYRRLAARLSFPFDATYDVETENEEELRTAVTVLGLIEPDDRVMDEGLLCKALEQGEAIELPLFAVDVNLDSENRKLIDAYAEWYLEADEEELSEVTFFDRVQIYSLNLKSSPPVFWKSVFIGICACGLVGFVVGATTGAMEIARISALVGAALVGSLGGFLGSGVGRGIAKLWASKPMGFVGGAFGMLAGGAIGATIGAMLVAFVGILAGAILGAILGAITKHKLFSLLAGLLLGPVLLALYLDKDNALMWGMHGAWIGALAAALLILLPMWLGRAALRTKNNAAT